MNDFTVGKLARQARVNVETLRYYERRRLLPKPLRSGANYRVYSPDDLRRVKFIKQAQALGFSLNEIKELLTLRAAPRAKCQDVKRCAMQKINEIEAKLYSLAMMRKNLQKLVDECAGNGPITQCPILESLELERPTVSEK